MSEKITCAVMQPTYLPWIGYLDLLDQVDIFIFLDDVQFSPRSWQQRNRIKTPRGLQWLTVPVRHVRREQRIHETAILDRRFAAKHLRTLAFSYSRAPFFATLMPLLQTQYERSLDDLASLAHFNEGLIRWLAAQLGITTTTLRSSELGVEGRRSAKLAALCRKVGARRYLSPMGSASYLLSELGIFQGFGIQVAFHGYEHPVYSQLYPPFCSHAAAVDLAFNELPRALEIIRSGRRAPLTPLQVARLQSKGTGS